MSVHQGLVSNRAVFDQIPSNFALELISQRSGYGSQIVIFLQIAKAMSLDNDLFSSHLQ